MEKEIILIGKEENKKYNGMFINIDIPLSEMNLVGGDVDSRYAIPTMKNLIIMVSNDNGKHNSGRIKVARRGIKSPFLDQNKYYEVFYDGDSVVFQGGSESKLSKRKKEIEEFYLRNKDIIQNSKNSKIPNDNLYEQIKETVQIYLNKKEGK